MDLPVLRATCEAAGYPLAEAQVQAFLAFQQALYEVNQHTNLTRVPREECELRHFVDSVLPMRLIPQGVAVLDIGTGAGFPAWPLACVRPDLRVTALDSTAKALRFVASQKLPNLTTMAARAESPTRREGFGFVTGRAVAPLAMQLEVSAAWCRVGGCVVPFRTPADEPAARSFPAARLGLKLEELVQTPWPESDVVRLFPVYRKVRHTPDEFPRSWAQIRAHPLG